MATVAMQESSDVVAIGPRVIASDPIYGEMLDFLNDDAELLDDDKHNEWLERTTDDIEYTIPVRKTVYRKDGLGFDPTSFHFHDNRKSLELRVRRSVGIATAYDRDPLPRIRRFISNVVVHETEAVGEYLVKSYIALYRNRFDDPHFDVLTGRREDIIRRTPEGLRLAKRTVYLDQVALGAPYLNIFM